MRKTEKLKKGERRKGDRAKPSSERSLGGGEREDGVNKETTVSAQH